MATFLTLNESKQDNGTDQFLVRQGDREFKINRETLAASIANARWVNDVNYLQHSVITGSDGVQYQAVTGTGPDLGGFVNPVTDTDRSSWKVYNISLESLTGMIGEFHDSGPRDGWIDLKGGVLSRATDALLWNYAVAAGMTVAQATKDADPMAHAMKFGDGDGSTTFTLPNHHLGHFVRGNPSGVNHGDTQGDAIRNITGETAVGRAAVSNNPATGAFETVANSTQGGDLGRQSAQLKFDASRVVPTADENRPYTANLSIKIHRGWM